MGLELYDEWISVFEKGEVEDYYLLKMMESNYTLKNSIIRRAKEIASTDYEKVEELRKNFVKDFPKEKIINLTMKEYTGLLSQNKNAKHSFTYRLEYETEIVGSISGQGDTRKYGIYCREGKRGFFHTKTYGETLEKAFDLLKRCYCGLIEASMNGDDNKVNSSGISANTIKYKVAYMYNPDRYLNIFTPSHLDHFHEKLNLENPPHAVVYQQQILLKEKISTEF